MTPAGFSWSIEPAPELEGHGFAWLTLSGVIGGEARSNRSAFLIGHSTALGTSAVTLAGWAWESSLRRQRAPYRRQSRRRRVGGQHEGRQAGAELHPDGARGGP